MNKNINLSNLLLLAKKNRTSRGIKRDNLFLNKRILDPNNKKDLQKIKRVKNVFQHYDVIGVDVGKKVVRKRKNVKNCKRNEKSKKAVKKTAKKTMKMKMKTNEPLRRSQRLKSKTVSQTIRKKVESNKTKKTLTNPKNQQIQRHILLTYQLE